MRLTTATPVGETVEIAINGSLQPKLVWEDGSETVVSSTGQLESVEVKSATFSVESGGSLIALYAPDAALTAIDLSEAPDLEVLNCPNNQLTELDLTGVTALKDLDVQGNALKEMNLTGKVNFLETLNCAYNELTALRLGAKPSLTTLICAGNQLKTLSLGNYPALRTVWCQDNGLTSLILPRLPFSAPDPLSEAEREQYPTLENYIREAVVPEMQRKLRQGFGRAIRTETDVCAVSILDRRACPGGRYHQAVLDALPECPVTHSVGEIEAFLRLKKGPEYFREERSWKNKNETYAMKSSITQPILI